jgi:uncharacterized protein (DUF1800 family)
MAAARLVLHAGIAATSEDIAAVKARGASTWLAEQMAMPMSERAYDWLMRRGYSALDEHRFVFADYPVDFAIAQQLIKAPDMLRKRVALALSEYFVVSLIGLETLAWRCFAAAQYWDQLNEGAFGNFRVLLESVTLNLAMGKYLNTLYNGREIPEIGRVPDENYAREVMQLFTIGLHQLNPDGTTKRDANGQPIPTYTADDVSNLARVFTGYEWYDTACAGWIPRDSPIEAAPSTRGGRCRTTRSSTRSCRSASSERRFRPEPLLSSLSGWRWTRCSIIPTWVRSSAGR